MKTKTDPAASNQAITNELRQWILEQVAKGCQPQDLLRTMLAGGWVEATARHALQTTLPMGVALLPAQAAAPDAPAAQRQNVPLPEPELAGAHSVIVVQGHPVAVVMNLQHPRVLVFGGLLTADECDELIGQARPRLERSQTVVNATGGSEVNVARTSDGMFFQRGQSPLIQRIEARIAALLNWPLERGEGLQILHYRPGAEYRPHFDYFDPAHSGTPTILQRGGQRVGTLVMYLNTPARGGATTFPDAALEVAAIKGNAVFFSYDRPDPATHTLHGGAPVLEGEKWVATKWLREGTFV